MNIITDSLPKTVFIRGGEYPINSDFRAAVEFEILIQSDASPRVKADGAVRLFFGENPPPYPIDIIVNAAAEFYAGFHSDNESNIPKSRKRLYSFSQDGGYIAAAFRSQYGIDILNIPYMHWYEFTALFRGLEENCEIVKIMGYRAADPKKIKCKSERERIVKLQEIYRLKSANAKKFMTLSERNAAMKNKVFADFERAKAKRGD